MPEETYKRRLNRTISRAMNNLDQPKGMCRIIRLRDKNCPFHIEWMFPKRKPQVMMKIRIVLDEVTEKDKKLAQEFSVPDICSKWIWLKEEDKRGFEPIEIL